MGDPLGIGPEVLVKALAAPSLRQRGRFLIFGASGALHEAAAAAGIAPFWQQATRDPAALGDAPDQDVLLIDREEGPVAMPAAAARRGPSEAGGALSFQLVEDAIVAAQSANAALVTGPISKEAWALAGRGQWPGHTELLAARLGSERFRMMFVSPRLRVILVTTHIGLMDVGAALTTERVHDTIELGHEACRRLGTPQPRIAVCGLNPHAGEAGKFGAEEERVIAPALELARAQGVDVSGPWPGDTIFRAAAAGRHDLVVAMYHDQGLIPVKLLDFHEAVNVTVGLPIIRTSPDHGTAFDIAGQNQADPGSMAAALRLACAMAGRGNPGAPGWAMGNTNL